MDNRLTWWTVLFALGGGVVVFVFGSYLIVPFFVGVVGIALIACGYRALRLATVKAALLLGDSMTALSALASLIAYCVQQAATEKATSSSPQKAYEHLDSQLRDVQSKLDKAESKLANAEDRVKSQAAKNTEDIKSQHAKDTDRIVSSQQVTLNWIKIHTKREALPPFATESKAIAKAFENGRSFFAKGDYDSAIKAWNEIITLDARNAHAYFNLGLLYQDKGDNDKAIANFTEVIRLNGNDAEAFFRRGATYYNKGDRDWPAIADFNEAIRLNPNYVEAYSNRGAVYVVWATGIPAEATTTRRLPIAVRPLD